jgi:hypothetical protein
LLPGSCDPKLLAGKPTITSLSLYFYTVFPGLHIVRITAFGCGIHDHYFLPLNWEKSMVLPYSRHFEIVNGIDSW